jgi:hypothetical protein
MNLKRYLTIYAALWKNSVARELSFKGNFILCKATGSVPSIDKRCSILTTDGFFSGARHRAHRHHARH